MITLHKEYGAGFWPQSQTRRVRKDCVTVSSNYPNGDATVATYYFTGNGWGVFRDATVYVKTSLNQGYEITFD